MGELINGRTPEQIRFNISECSRSNCLSECPYENQPIESCAEGLLSDALALIERLEATLERLGEFGKLFEEYTGCPRGATGRAALPIEEEVLAMKPIRDVDHGEWIPVNADALRELVAKYKQLRDAVPKWISVEERLPEPFVSVLVHMPGERPHPTVREGYISSEGIWVAGYFRRKSDEVTHWVEMPEPPEEE